MIEEKAIAPPNCNFCNKPLHHRFMDILAPLNDFQETVEKFPQTIHTYICDSCFLVQVDCHNSARSMYTDYNTSYSSGWYHSMQEFAHGIFKRLEPTVNGFELELIDHAMLKESHEIFPIITLAKKDVSSIIEMYGKSDRILCHNEMAYARDVNDFVAAIKLLLAPKGTVVMEFEHLLGLMEGEKFTKMVSGVFAYFSFTFVDIVFKNHRLVIYDVENCLPEGYIRISAKHQENVTTRISVNTPAMRGKERDSGMSSLAYYMNFKSKTERQMESYECV